MVRPGSREINAGRFFDKNRTGQYNAENFQEALNAYIPCPNVNIKT